MKWKYWVTVIPFNESEFLDGLGGLDWELVSVIFDGDSKIAYFKKLDPEWLKKEEYKTRLSKMNRPGR